MSSEFSGRILAILSFHKVGEPSPEGWRSWFYTPEEAFVGCLSYLRENGWPVIDVSAFLGGLKSPDSLPTRAALLTFDDGYRSIREIALPWLRRFGYPAVLFVPTGYIGRYNTFDDGTEPEEAICDWDDLRELQRSGVSIQSHGASHRPLSQLDLDEQRQELVRSKAELEAGLGSPVNLFAFPYGDGGTDPRAMSGALERAGYQAACLYGGGPNPLPIADPYRLARLAFGSDTDPQAALGLRGRLR